MNKWAKSEKAVLVFVRTIDDVKTVCATLTDKKNGGVEPGQVQMLTGTLRGLERDRLATADAVFARFMPEPKVTPQPGTVFLVCTSAGEVGVDISADHMVCDLTTLDSMAQRFGRVNRRGEGDVQIDVVYETDPDLKKKDDGFEKARWKSKEVLERLQKDERHDASPSSLGVVMKTLTEEEREAAFAPPPTILPATDILFDAWSLTTIKGKLPGRPKVEPYLHGLTNWQPPETHVAWREEVEKLNVKPWTEWSQKEFAKFAADLLDEYPLKPHELLKEPSHRAFKQFEAMAKRLANTTVPVWLVDDDGKVEVLTLAELADKDKKDLIEKTTVLLPPSAGGLESGMLNGTAANANDVADEWFSDKEKIKRVRIRVWDDAPVPDDMRLIDTIDTKPEADESDEESAGHRFWRWFAVANEGDKSAKKPVRWDVHVGDVVTRAEGIIANLPLDQKMKDAIHFAARFHDHGKRRKLFQTVLGNTDPNVWLAKSGKKGGRVKEQYRHEFGSLLDVTEEPDFQKLTDDQKELVLHLIAVHHGRGRPHFPRDEAFDPERPQDEVDQLAADVPRRFARLQHQYGRWGLAYLESLLRAADWAAS